MTLRGNVIVQGSNQSNTSQIVAVYNDAGYSNLTLNVTLLYNTFVGNTGHAALVHLSNADGTKMSAQLSNNIVYGTNTPVLVEDTSQGAVTGTNNWLVTGAAATGLSGSVFGSDPSFKNAAQGDYTLAAGSQAVGAAVDSVTGLPTREYYRNEAVKCSYRTRASAKDIGAFESTTQGTAIGPHGTGTGGTTSTGGATSTVTGGKAATGGTASAAGTASNSGDAGGCNCRVHGHQRAPIGGALLIALAALVGARRRRQVRPAPALPTSHQISAKSA